MPTFSAESSEAGEGPLLRWPASIGTPSWAVQCVDCPKDYFEIGDRSLALDAAGQPHLAYAGDSLTYAWHDGTGWHFEIVDQAPGIEDLYQSAPCLALDASGTPRLSYLDSTNQALQYARKTAQGWEIQTVDTAAPRDKFQYDTALALDSSGNPHIAYSDAGTLKVAYWTGITWVIEPVDPSGWVGWHISMALDSANTSHISYYDDQAGILKYAHRIDSGWEIQIVDASAWLGEFNSIAVDRTGAPHISYIDYTNGNLKYAHWTESGWDKQVVDTAKWLSGFTSLALDSIDHPHISYTSTGNEARVARWSENGWEIRPLADRVWGTSLALPAPAAGAPGGGDDYPHVAYFDWDDGDLHYVQWTGDGWNGQTVDSTGEVGRYSALALDGQGRAHIGYTDENHHTLRYASWENGWQTEIVDRIGNDGGYIDLALDGAGVPYVSYYEGTRGDLRVARLTPTGWFTQTVDSVGITGAGTSLALDSDGRPHVSYYDTFSGTLKYAYWTGETWVRQTVDSTGQAGAFASLALDSGNRPHIGYYDTAHGDLRYAHWTGTAWATEPVDTVGDVGAYVSLALPAVRTMAVPAAQLGFADVQCREQRGRRGDASLAVTDASPHPLCFATGLYSEAERAGSPGDDAGMPHISYYDNTNGHLKYARRTGGGWVLETVDSAGHVGSFSSLALDSTGDPTISYCDTGQPEGGLRVAGWTGSGWITHTVEAGSLACAGTSLALPAVADASPLPLQLATGLQGEAGLCPRSVRSASLWNPVAMRSGRDSMPASEGTAVPWPTCQGRQSGPERGKARQERAGTSGDPAVYAHVSYYDEGSHDLKYAVERPIRSTYCPLVFRAAP